MAIVTCMRIYQVHKKEFGWKNLKIIEQPRYMMENNKKKDMREIYLWRG
jgi:hypothetical protein